MNVSCSHLSETSIIKASKKALSATSNLHHLQILIQ